MELRAGERGVRPLESTTTEIRESPEGIGHESQPGLGPPSVFCSCDWALMRLSEKQSCLLRKFQPKLEAAKRSQVSLTGTNETISETLTQIIQKHLPANLSMA